MNNNPANPTTPTPAYPPIPPFTQPDQADPHARYTTPLSGRYASSAMQAIWSDHRKFSTWRRLWLALAESEKQLGLPVNDKQVAQLREHLDDIDYAAAAGYEKKLRHDVMAHVHALGDVAPDARPIIHLGATSQFVNCNTELIQLRDALDLIAGKLATTIDRLATFAAQHRDLPTLGFTHYQPAQPTTVGKRATLWAYDLALALDDIEHRRNAIRFRGVKGTTGTQASFLALFQDQPDPHHCVDQLDNLVTSAMGFDPDHTYTVTGQTYPRIVDAQVLGSLASTAASISKIASDIRLLANRKEIEEPFEKNQIGSSAMAYKRNPMRCERATALARFVMAQASNATMTAATQWLERTLDDSANRRMSLPESFLALDGCLDLMTNIATGMVVYPATIARNLAAELPFMATENIMMAAVRQGADRQEIHEIIRVHSQAAAANVKSNAADNDLLDRLKSEPAFKNIDLTAVLDPYQYTGRAPQQVDAFIEKNVTPIRHKYADQLGNNPTLNV